jgi:hypothetical protein
VRGQDQRGLGERAGQRPAAVLEDEARMERIAAVLDDLYEYFRRRREGQ